jgi:hypothetical protein
MTLSHARALMKLVAYCRRERKRPSEERVTAMPRKW